MIFALRNIRASRVNLLMNDFAAGAPSPLAFLGLASAIAGKAGLDRWSVRVLPVLHSVSVSEGRTKPEMEIKEGRFTPIETAEDMVGTIDVSLLVDIPGMESETDLEQAFFSCRIAGGAVQNDDHDAKSVTPDGSAFQSLRRGYAFIPPRGPGAVPVSRGDIESLRALAKYLFPVKKEAGSGWILPAAVGYRLLEDPGSTPVRSGTRDPNVPHVFAEPLTSAAELMSVRNPHLTSLSEEGLRGLMWSWTVTNERILGHDAYLHNATIDERMNHVET